MILSVFITVISGHDKPQPPGCLLEALNTGHEGSISTIHANNTYASFSRLASIVKQSSVGMTVDMDLIMRTIKTSIDVILFSNHTYMTELYYDPEEKNRLLSTM
ncbi:CpaF/VirB11 family protein [Escherichia coli]|nr:CpaF/VirB11 family protein [Escherichia coli]